MDPGESKSLSFEVPRILTAFREPPLSVRDQDLGA
jgi:hypothetical protein